MHVVDDERRDPIYFWVLGSKVKVNFGTLPLKPCSQNTDCNFARSLSNSLCKLLMMRDPIHFGS